MINRLFVEQLSPLLMTSLMAATMSGVLSLYWTVISAAVPDFAALFSLFSMWLLAWGKSFAIALPTSLLVAPFIRRLVTQMTLNKGEALVSKE